MWPEKEPQTHLPSLPDSQWKDSGAEPDLEENIIAYCVGEQPVFIRPGYSRLQWKGPWSFLQTYYSPSLALVNLNFVFCAADENQN